MKTQNEKNYLAPTIKVVKFMVEQGFAGSPDPTPTNSAEQMDADGSTASGDNWSNGWNE